MAARRAGALKNPQLEKSGRNEHGGSVALQLADAATVRFVLLPLASHGYAARESVSHTLWERNSWLNTDIKNPPPMAAAKSAGDQKAKPFAGQNALAFTRRRWRQARCQTPLSKET